MKLQLGQGEGCTFVEQVLLVFQRVGFPFSISYELLENGKHCFQIISRRGDEDMMTADFAREYIETKNFIFNNYTVLYKKNIWKSIEKASTARILRKCYVPSSLIR